MNLAAISIKPTTQRDTPSKPAYNHPEKHSNGSGMDTPSKGSLRPQPVHFEVPARHAHEVWLVGSFNDWNLKATPMMRARDGTWTCDLDLPPGRYEYLFVIDGRWISDPKATETAPNPYGGCNSLLEVSRKQQR